MTKSKLREELKLRIAELPESYVAKSSSAIFQRLLSLPEFINAGRIFAYFSVDREIDTLALIDHCLLNNIPLALPRTEANRQMSFALIDSADSLKKSAFGIPEPDKALPCVSPKQGDLIVVPALCYDERGFRLGHGGGYYDRFLSGCRAETVGLCRQALLCPTLPTQPHDIPVKILITEQKTARPV